MTPSTLRLAVLASTNSPIASSSVSSGEGSTPIRVATAANAAGCQNRTFAYQSPSTPDEVAGSGSARPTRSRNFLVPRTTITHASLPLVHDAAPLTTQEALMA